MYSHPDPTAYRAIGAAEKEWLAMAKLAYRYRTNPGSTSSILEPHRIFTGIFRRLLTDPLEDLERLLFPTRRRTTDQK